MKKLSAIFETVDSSTGNFNQSIADQIVESLLYENQLTESVSKHTLSEMQSKLVEIGNSMETEEQAMKFGDDVFARVDSEFNEAFEGVKQVWDNVKTAVKKMWKNFRSSPVEKAIGTFNTSIKTAHATLIKTAGVKESLILEATEKLDLKALKTEIEALKVTIIDKDINIITNTMKELKDPPTATLTPNGTIFGKLPYKVGIEYDVKTNNYTISASAAKKTPLLVFSPDSIKIEKEATSALTVALLIGISKTMVDKKMLDKELSFEDINPGTGGSVKRVISFIKDKPEGEATDKPEGEATDKPEGEATDKPEGEATDKDSDELLELATELYTVLGQKKEEAPEFVKHGFSADETQQFIDYASNVEIPGAKDEIMTALTDKDAKTALSAIKSKIEKDLSTNGAKITEALVAGSKIPMKPTGFSKKGMKKFKVDKVNGNTVCLYVGDKNDDTMKPIFVYNKSAKIIALYIDPTVFTDIARMKFLGDIIEGFAGSSDEKINAVFTEKFKSVTATGTGLKVDFSGNKNIKSGGTGMFLLKNGKLVYKAANELLKLAAIEGEVEEVEGAVEIETETETEDGKKEEETNPAAAQGIAQFKEALKKSNFASNIKLLTANLGIDPTETNKNLIAMVTSHNGHLPTILLKSKLIEANYAPMKDNEFLGYMANLEGILQEFIVPQSSPKTSKIWTPTEFNVAAYSKFLQESKAAANVLNDVVNNSMTSVPVVKKQKADAKTKADQEAATAARNKDTAGKVTKFEELVKKYPKVAESLTKAHGGKAKAPAKLLVQYALEIDKMQSFIDMNSFPSIINTNPKFFNAANIDDKIAFVANLYKDGLTVEQINMTLKTILYNNIENNFREVAPFENTRDVKVFLDDNQGNEEEAFKGIQSDAFDKSKF